MDPSVSANFGSKSPENRRKPAENRRFSLKSGALISAGFRQIPPLSALCYKDGSKNGAAGLIRLRKWRKWRKMAALKITNARQVDSADPGSYTVAENLILRVKPNGARSWVFRYQSHGKVKELGLGKAGMKERGLGEAKELAEKMRAAVRNGDDPRSILKPKHDPSAMTFKRYAERYVEGREADHKAGKHKNRSAKHLAQWGSTLERYAYALIGDKLPKDITYAHIEDIARAKDLAAKAETKYRVIQRVKVVLDEAADHDHSRFNPAARYLTKLKRDSRDVAHHAYAPVDAVPAIYAALKAKDATSALVLRWSILTACRSGEARGALWSEIEGDMCCCPLNA